jgi:hypothetical protein
MEQLTTILAGLNIDEEARTNVTNAVTDALTAAVRTAEAQSAAAVTAAQAQTAQRDFNDNMRTVAAVLKPTKPKPYTGAIDAVACLNFIENQEEYYQIVNLNENEWVKYTAVSLEGDAKAWWRDSGLNLTSSWQEFRQAFIDYFTPPDTTSAARMELSKLKQGKLSVADYTTKFRRMARLIPSMDRETTLFLYTHGLESDTSREVRLRQPTTLDEAIKLATIIHNILRPVAPTAVVAPAAPVAQQPTAEPMDLDSLRILLTNLTKTTGINAFQRPLPKLTNTERDRLRRIGACFRCRRTGHLASACRSGRTLNNLETGLNANDESGKDQGEA